MADTLRRQHHPTRKDCELFKGFLNSFLWLAYLKKLENPIQMHCHCLRLMLLVNDWTTFLTIDRVIGLAHFTGLGLVHLYFYYSLGLSKSAQQKWKLIAKNQRGKFK